MFEGLCAWLNSGGIGGSGPGQVGGGEAGQSEKAGALKVGTPGTPCKKPVFHKVFQGKPSNGAGFRGLEHLEHLEHHKNITAEKNQDAGEVADEHKPLSMLEKVGEAEREEAFRGKSDSSLKAGLPHEHGRDEAAYGRVLEDVRSFAKYGYRLARSDESGAVYITSFPAAFSSETCEALQADFLKSHRLLAERSGEVFRIQAEAWSAADLATVRRGVRR